MASAANEYVVRGVHRIKLEDIKLEDELARLDELVLQGELARLNDTIQAAIDAYFEWGQFEAWWKNTTRTQTLEGPNGAMTYSHTDDLLRALLLNYRQIRLSQSRVFWAWRYLLFLFYKNRDDEQWKMAHRPLGDWQPSDPRGPHANVTGIISSEI